MSVPFFSIVIPVYNRTAAIRAALNSVLAQTMRDYEVIVVDDGSTDDTVAVATVLSAKFTQPIRIIQQANAGPGHARNNGIARASGQYVAFLDSDDVWFPWTLSLYQKAITECDSPAFVCGTPIDVKLNDPINVDGNQPMSLERHADFFSVPGNPFFRFTTSGVAIRRSSLSAVGGFAAERINYEDLDLWMRLGVAPGFVLIVNPPNVVRCFFGDNISMSRKFNRSGSAYMIASEKQDRYPGGRKRQQDRRRLLTTLMRAASSQMVKAGDIPAGFFIYRKIFFWSLDQLRWRYIVGFPIQMALGMLGKG